MPVLDTNDIHVESKWHYFVRKGVEKGKQVLEYMEEHKEVVAIATTLVVGALSVGKKLAGGVAKMSALHAERDLKDFRVYDRRLGAYLRLRRPLNNSDWKLITQKLNTGERLADILQKMDMLK